MSGGIVARRLRPLLLSGFDFSRFHQSDSPQRFNQSFDHERNQTAKHHSRRICVHFLLVFGNVFPPLFSTSFFVLFSPLLAFHLQHFFLLPTAPHTTTTTQKRFRFFYQIFHRCMSTAQTCRRNHYHINIFVDGAYCGGGSILLSKFFPAYFRIYCNSLSLV